MLRALYATVLTLVGCAVEPPTDQPLAPLATYPAWYQAAEACSGAQGDYGALRFFLRDSRDIEHALHLLPIRPDQKGTRENQDDDPAAGTKRRGFDHSMPSANHPS